MAMTKADRAFVDALRIELALRWPRYEMPPNLRIEKRGPLITGWWANGFTGHVSEGCTDGINHSSHSTTKTSIQGAGRFWPTKLDALKAVRIEMSHRFARELAAVDARIADAEAEAAT